jgi:hypothetical protein
MASRPAGGQRDETPRPDYPAAGRITHLVARRSVLSPPARRQHDSHREATGQGSADMLRCRAGTPTRLRRPRTARSIRAGRAGAIRTLRGQGSLALMSARGLRQPRVGLSPSGHARPARPTHLDNSRAGRDTRVRSPRAHSEPQGGTPNTRHRGAPAYWPHQDCRGAGGADRAGCREVKCDGTAGLVGGIDQAAAAGGFLAAGEVGRLP